MMAALFTPEYEAELRKRFLEPNPERYLLGALRAALEPNAWDGVARARGMLAIFDEVNGRAAMMRPAVNVSGAAMYAGGKFGG